MIKREKGIEKYISQLRNKYSRHRPDKLVVFSQCNRRANLWGLANSWTRIHL